MLLRLSRLSLWLAAAAGALALFGPAAQQALCIDIALALAAAAFATWRSALALRARLGRPLDALLEPAALDAVFLREAGVLVVRAVADARSFEAALQRAAQILRGELGARATRVFLVCHEEGAQVLTELLPCKARFRVPQRAIARDDSVLARALRERSPAIDLPRALALPVLLDDSVVALLELVGIEMQVDAAALAQLLATTQQSLAGRGAPFTGGNHAQAQQPASRRLAPSWTAALGVHDERGSCAC